jgi:hypothetical protein
VHDAAAMRSVEGAGHLRRERQRLVDGERASRQTLLQRLTVEILHDQERDRVGRRRTLTATEGEFAGRDFPNVVEGADMRMVQLGDCPRFAFEPLAANGACGHVRRQDLDRHRAVEPRIARPVYFAHPADALQRLDLIRAEARPAHEAALGERVGVW